MRRLLHSVGRRGTNKPEDVRTVQQLLNGFHQNRVRGAGAGLESRAWRRLPRRRVKLQVDGVVGPETLGAIEEYQRYVLGAYRPDGRIDPRGPTIQALNGGLNRTYPRI